MILLIPILVSVMRFVRREYDDQALELQVHDDFVVSGPHREQRVVIPVNGINRAVVQAVNFGRTIAQDVRAVYVTDNAEDGQALRIRWGRQVPGVPLVIVESPYRALIGPVVAYLDVLDLAWPPDKPAPITIVVLPEYVARHWWERLLYNQTAKRLKAALDRPRAHGGRRRAVSPRWASAHRAKSRRRAQARRRAMIGGRRPLGRKPADRRVRVERPHAPYFRYTGPGQMVAKEAASRPETPVGRGLARVRGVVFGRVLASEEEIGERLAKRKALAIFSSDAISSSAYATEEILKVLIVAGAGALAYSVGVSVAIAVLLAVVSVSYRQVCRAYPSGGGAYVVARENLSRCSAWWPRPRCSSIT